MKKNTRGAASPLPRPGADPAALAAATAEGGGGTARGGSRRREAEGDAGGRPRELPEGAQEVGRRRRARGELAAAQ